MTTHADCAALHDRIAHLEATLAQTVADGDRHLAAVEAERDELLALVAELVTGSDPALLADGRRVVAHARARGWAS